MRPRVSVLAREIKSALNIFWKFYIKNILIFLMVNTFSYHHCQSWSEQLLVELTYMVLILWRILTIAFPSNLFKNDVFSEGWNRHFRRSTVEIEIYCQTIMGRLLNIFWEVLSVDFTLWWWYLCNLLEKRKKAIVIQISPSTITRHSQESPKRNEKL